MTEDLSKAKEIVSPEGVEEKLVTEITGRVTFTMGGKYRGYLLIDDQVFHSVVHDSCADCVKDVGFLLMVAGRHRNDPSGMRDNIIEMLSKKGSK